MARTVVYDPPLVQAHMLDVAAEERTPPKASRAQRKKAEDRTDKKQEPKTDKERLAELPDKDTYLSKIAKYVPAETVAVTLLLFAAFDFDGNTIWLVLALAALANVVYLFSLAVSMPKTQRPRGYFYFLSIPAFFGWAVAVIEPVKAKAGISGADAPEQEAFILAATAFLVPALDTILSKLDISIGD